MKARYAIDNRNDGGYAICAGSTYPDAKKKCIYTPKYSFDSNSDTGWYFSANG